MYLKAAHHLILVFYPGSPKERGDILSTQFVLPKPDAKYSRYTVVLKPNVSVR